MLKKTEMSLA